MDDIILLVEDSLDHTVLVQALLDYHGLGRHVTVTETVSQAKSYLLSEWPFHEKDRHPRPNLIILDHWLDDGTGLDLLEWLNEHRELRGIPVIVFTGCEDTAVRDQAFALGARDFVLKPGGYEELGKAIERLVTQGLVDRSPDKGEGPGAAKAG
ncbi:MAG: response regulator [Gemmatimonadetes bacterium]|nr:response regulator [Gemmatimonadota bacterium]